MDPRILCFDTSIDVCSVALSGTEQRITYKEERGINLHASRLNLIIESIIQEAGISFKELDAICVCKGPGSYTGLRIGVSSAKGLCYALDKPLLSINSLEIMAKLAIKNIKEPEKNALLCPMIDARRMEVYSAAFDMNGAFVSETKAEVVDELYMKDELASHPVYFFGNGMAKCRNLLETSPHARFIDEAIYPRADYMAIEAIKKYHAGNFEELFTFEPFYLKDFYTTAGSQHLK